MQVWLLLCNAYVCVNIHYLHRYRMQKVMLTVQRSNGAAHALYKTLWYSEDETSPTEDPDDPNQVAGYTILSKALPPGKQIQTTE